MASSQERSFIEQTESGGDLDALVYVKDDSSGGVRIEDATDHDGGTRLFWAAGKGWCPAVNYLLKRGADVHLATPHYEWTPLHKAVFHGHRDTAVLLLDSGARVDDRTRIGRTALHIAAALHSRKICKLLLSRGASLDPRDDEGRNPEAEARYRGHTTKADLLAAVRAAGGWLPYLNAPRKELLALRQQLPALRDRGRAAPSSSVRAHERLFLKTPDDVFGHVLAFWRSDRDD